MRVRKNRKEMAEGDMTPMIDMVFQLIAFFMVLINFTDAEQDDRVKLPLSELAKPPEVAYEKPITLQMTGDDEAIFGGELMTIDELELALKREAQIFGASDVKLSDVTVIIRADAGAKTGMVQAMIEASQEAKFETFALRGQQSDVKVQKSKKP